MNKNPKFDYNKVDFHQPSQTDSVLKSTPLIFTKKVRDNSKIIPQNITLNTLGQTKHFPAATKEWFNSIYSYNNNLVKNIPALDKTLARILNSYFNIYLKPSFFKSAEENKLTSKHLSNASLPTLHKRLSLDKILLGKAELKHTNNKVIITLFVYNAEKLSLNHDIISGLTRIWPSLNVLKDLSKDKKDDLELLTFKSRFAKILNLCRIILNILAKTKPKNTAYNLKNSPDYMRESGLIDTATRKSLAKRLESYEAFVDTTINPDIFKAGIFKAATMIYLNQEAEYLAEAKMKLAVNKAKFEESFLSKLTPLISKLYNNKQVEFNIVNIKNLYLNSDIFVQAVATRFKNKENTLVKTLNYAFSLIKLPKVNKIRDKYAEDDRARVWMNRAKNLALNSYSLNNVNKDALSELLLNILPIESTASEIQDIALTNIKHRILAGARLEIKGRLTRRNTASRSVFKLKWKGSLKNIESSYRGLSTIVLRGHAQSNHQYSVINSKTRQGTFGIKGWIAGK